MSQENVELFRRGLAAWNREGVTGVLAVFHDDVVAHPFPEWPGDPVYHGHDGIRELLAEWTEHFDDYSWAEERVVPAGDDLVVALVFHQARIKGTDVPIKQPMGTVWKMESGKAIEAWFFLTWQEALETVGLSE
jgi:ketosteroid isomerase-like protein